MGIVTSLVDITEETRVTAVTSLVDTIEVVGVNVVTSVIVAGK